MTVASITADNRYALPDAQTIEEVGELNLLDESGNPVPFKSLYTDDNATGRSLIIFIRHFYCGLCEAYVESLTQELPQSNLDTLTPPVKLTIIGCGSPAPLPDYKQRTKCGFPILCDPDRKLYAKLGLVENLSMGSQKPEYLKASAFSTTMNSAWNAISAGPGKSLKAGNFAQNGGELLFEFGKLTWCHRMQNTRDHAEISELKKVLKI